jgi:Helix-loop-helix DNA-binding domain
MWPSLTLPHLQQHNLHQDAILGLTQQRPAQQEGVSGEDSSAPTPLELALQVHLTSKGAISNVNDNSDRDPPNRKRSRDSEEHPVCPSIVSTAGSSSDTDSPNSRANAEVSDQPTSEAQRQRQERNRREQLRAQRLCEQIEALRDLLVASNIYCSPNKHAILSHVVQYIGQLQSRALTIDAEQQRLQATIRSTTELLQGGGGGSGIADADSTSLSSNDSGDDDDSDDDDDDDDDDGTSTTAVPESYPLCANEVVPSEAVVYEDVVSFCPFPIGIVALDGHIVTSNGEFERLFNPQYPRASLLANQSLFAHVRNHGEVFHAMERLLRLSLPSEHVSASDTKASVHSQPPNQQQLYWSGSLQTMSNNETVSFMDIACIRVIRATPDSFWRLLLTQVSAVMTLTDKRTVDGDCNSPGYFCIVVKA